MASKSFIASSRCLSYVDVQDTRWVLFSKLLTCVTGDTIVHMHLEACFSAISPVVAFADSSTVLSHSGAMVLFKVSDSLPDKAPEVKGGQVQKGVGRSQ